MKTKRKKIRKYENDKTAAAGPSKHKQRNQHHAQNDNGKYANCYLDISVEKLIALRTIHTLRITNLFFKHKPIHQTIQQKLLTQIDSTKDEKIQKILKTTGTEQ